MRIALFSDIHANLPALEAFFRSLEETKPDQLYCLGDLVGFNVWPNEVVSLLKSKHIPILAGNHDYLLGKAKANSIDYNKLNEASRSSTLYTEAILGQQEKEYLANLPARIQLSFQFGSKNVTLLLVHGSAYSIDELLYKEIDDHYLYEMMKVAGADIMCFGHTHIPFQKKLNQEGNSSHERYAVNIGSIGKPKDGDPRGCYAILNIREDLKVINGYSFDAEFIRFDYDIEKAALAIENSSLPKILASMLREAY